MRATVRIIACAAAACACVFGQRAGAYLLITEVINDRQVSFHWTSFPVRYSVTDRGVQGVTLPQLQTAIDKSFRVWQDVPTASITFQAAGVTGASPFEEDGITTLGFLSRPDLEGVLGATGYIVDEITGEILESDIFFNSQYPWSVAESGEPGRIDLESVAVHEIGHLLGLGHSGLGQIDGQGDRRRVAATEAVMFPIAFDPGTIDGRRLKADDIAGVSDLYPDGAFRSTTGAIRGRVRKANQGVLGAHVIAMNPGSGKLIAGFSINREGDFTIAGLDPGLHVLRIEPIDDGDIESFFSDSSSVDLDFKTAYFQRLMMAPSGGTTNRFDIELEPK
jgi:hypothetical protein